MRNLHGRLRRLERPRSRYRPISDAEIDAALEEELLRRGGPTLAGQRAALEAMIAEVEEELGGPS